MKLVVAGSRNFTQINRFDLERYIYFFGLEEVLEIVSGSCSTGPDNAAIWYSKHEKLKLKEFPADWGLHGKAAGPIRNGQMAEYGDALLLIWDGESRGSASMKSKMQALKKPVYEVILRGMPK